MSEGWVTEIMADVSPDTVLTFGPDGMTGHDDHKSASRWASAAFEQVAPTHAVLGYATNTPEWLAQFREELDRFNVFMGAEPPCTPVDATSQPMSVDHALTMGVTRSMRACAAARSAASGCSRAVSSWVPA